MGCKTTETGKVVRVSAREWRVELTAVTPGDEFTSINGSPQSYRSWFTEVRTRTFTTRREAAKWLAKTGAKP